VEKIEKHNTWFKISEEKFVDLFLNNQKWDEYRNDSKFVTFESLDIVVFEQMLKFLFGYKSKVRIEHEQIGMDWSEHQQRNKDKNVSIKNEDLETKYRRHA